MSTVGIIILNYNSTRLTKKCIKSLLSQKEQQDTYHIVVYDNDSKIQPKKDDFPDCIVVHSQQNHGFALGNNKAVQALFQRVQKVDFLLFLNNDTRVGKGMVHKLVEAFHLQKDVGMVVPKIYFEKGAEFFSADYTENQRGKVVWYSGGSIDWDNCIVSHKGIDEIDYGQFSLAESQEEGEAFATGCCFLTTPEIWKKLRGFDQRYFLYYEDVDLSLRMIRRLKKRIIVEQSAVLYHINAGSSDGSGSAVHQYYQTRSRLLFSFLHAPKRTQLAVLNEARRMFFSGNPPRKLGILDALGGRWGNQTARIPVEKH